MRRLIAGLLAAALLLLGCGCESILFPIAPTTPTPKGETEQNADSSRRQLEDLAQEENLTAKDGTTLVHYTVALPQFAPEEGGLAVMNRYYRQEYSNFVSTAQEELRQIAESNLQTHEETGEEYMACEARQTYVLERWDDRYLSVSREITMSFGSVAVESYYKGDTFDVETGSSLRLQDVFRVPSEEYLPRLRDAVISQLEGLQQTDTAGRYFDQAEARVEAYLMEDNFWLEEHSLTLFFPDGTLGEKICAFPIALEQLSDLLVEGVR